MKNIILSISLILISISVHAQKSFRISFTDSIVSIVEKTGKEESLILNLDSYYYIKRSPSNYYFVSGNYSKMLPYIQIDSVEFASVPWVITSDSALNDTIIGYLSSVHSGGGSSIDTSVLAGLNRTTNIFNGSIKLGTATGTGLLNFPDSTNAANGISFGSGSANLYRYSSSTLKTDGNLLINGVTYINSELANLITGIVRSGQSMHIAGNPLTGSSATSALSISQTWNTTGNPTLIFANVTNTASGATSNLMDLQINSSTVYKFTKMGNLDFNNGSYGGITFGSNNNKGVFYESSSTSNTIYSQYNSHNFKVFNGTSYASRLLINNTGVYVGTSSIKASAALEVETTTQGFLTPRMTTAQKLAIASPAEGLEVYDLTLHQKSYYNGTAWIDY